MITRSNLIIPELLVEAIQGQFAGHVALWGTGVAVVSPTLPASGPSGSKIRGGDTIKVPYFGTIGELDDIPTENDALTPAALSMTSDSAIVQHSGKAVEISDWAQMAAMYADPYQEFARQLDIATQRRGDLALLQAAATGLPSQMIWDLVIAGTTLNYDTMVDARMLFGDEQADILLLTVHSQVFKNLMHLKDTTGRPLLILPTEGDTSLARFNGIPVAVSDRNTVDTTTHPGTTCYHSKILKKDALVFWFSKEPTVDTDKDILADSVVAAIHVYYVAYRYQRTPGATRPGVVDILTVG